MKRLGGLFFLGLAALLPAGLLVYLLFGMLRASERLFSPLLLRWLPEGSYLPGMGVALTVLLILFTGALARSWVGPKIGQWFSRLVIRLPLLGRAYLTLRRLSLRLNRSESQAFQRVVLVPDNNDGGRLGLVADDTPLQLGGTGQALVPVYFPQPFQPGGDFALVPAARLQATDMSVDTALGLVLTGGLARDDVHD